MVYWIEVQPNGWLDGKDTPGNSGGVADTVRFDGYNPITQVNQANRKANIDAMNLSFIFLPAIEFLGVLSTGIVLWFGGQAVGSGEVTLGVLVAFLSYVTRFFQPVQELSRMYTTFQAAMAGGEQVVNLLDTLPAVKDAPGAVEIPPIKGQVILDHVSFRYRPELPEVLHDIYLKIEPGQTVALVGPTGAGKTFALLRREATATPRAGFRRQFVCQST